MPLVAVVALVDGHGRIMFKTYPGFYQGVDRHIFSGVGAFAGGAYTHGTKIVMLYLCSRGLIGNY